MNVKQETREPLRAELAELETCLETPLVPGELERWSECTLAAWRSLSAGFAHRFECEQPQMLDQIAADDPELLERVDELRRHNGQVLAMYRDLNGQIEAFVRRARRVEPDEKRLDDELEQVVEAGLRFVIEARKQEVALRTWMMEAYERETGPVD